MSESDFYCFYCGRNGAEDERVWDTVLDRPVWVCDECHYEYATHLASPTYFNYVRATIHMRRQHNERAQS